MPGLRPSAPVDAANGLYVERLGSGRASLEESLILNEGMTLYFQTTSDNVNPADPDGFVTSGGGVLRWVKGDNAAPFDHVGHRRSWGWACRSGSQGA